MAALDNYYSLWDIPIALNSLSIFSFRFLNFSGFNRRWVQSLWSSLGHITHGCTLMALLHADNIELLSKMHLQSQPHLSCKGGHAAPGLQAQASPFGKKQIPMINLISHLCLSCHMNMEKCLALHSAFLWRWSVPSSFLLVRMLLIQSRRNAFFFLPGPFFIAF